MSARRWWTVLREYVRLRRTQDTWVSLLGIGVLIGVFGLAIPQAWGTEIIPDRHAGSFIPVAESVACALFLAPRWSGSFESAVTARPVTAHRAAIAVGMTLLHVAVAVVLLLRGAVPSIAFQVGTTGFAAIGLTAMLSAVWSPRLVGRVFPFAVAAYIMLPWWVGDATVLGNGVGEHVAPLVTAAELAAGVVGLAAWAAAGRRSVVVRGALVG